MPLTPVRAWGKRVTVRTAKTVLTPQVIRRFFPSGLGCLWIRVPAAGVWPVRAGRFIAAQLNELPVEQAPPSVAVAWGKHPTLQVIRRALQDASRAAPPGLQRLERLLAETQRGQEGVVEQRADLRGPRQRPLAVAQDAAVLSLPPLLRRLLYYLVRSLRPAVAVELGTAHGVSALHIATGMEEVRHGHLHTIDGDPVRRALALENLRAVLSSDRVTSHEGYFAKVLPSLLDRLGEPVDLAFDDGDHLPASTLGNFRLLFPRFRAGAVLLVDDINHPTGNVTAWRAIIAEPGVAAWVEVNTRLGICIKA
jgi:predicted O-methyltransferase YrrM